MSIRFATARVTGAALALTIGSAAGLTAQTATPSDTSATPATAGAATTSTSVAAPSSSMGTMQDSTARRRTTRTTTRRRPAAGTPVRKDLSAAPVAEPAPAPLPAPAPEPAPQPPPAPEPGPVPAPVPAPAPAPEPVVTTTTTTTTTQLETPKLGNGFYFGVQGGANLPQNNIRDAYRTGYNGGIQLGYDPETSPIGLRVNALYNRFRGDRNGAFAANVNRVTDSETYSAFADAVLRLPFGKFLGATSGFYLVGGPGVTLFRNYQDFQRQTGTIIGTPATGTGSSSNSTRFALNGGAGLEYGIGNTSLFVEGRYVRIFTQTRDTDYVPLNFGLRFHR
jgi:hypothetical protein